MPVSKLGHEEIIGQHGFAGVNEKEDTVRKANLNIYLKEKKKKNSTGLESTGGPEEYEERSMHMVFREAVKPVMRGRDWPRI